MLTIDLNCDMGEGTGNEVAIMPYISSANIACGFHAGNLETIQQTVQLCLKHDVAIGAHPSFFDKENFGRTEKHLPPDEIYDIVMLQLRTIDKILKANGKKLQHVKPHGALYNMSAKDRGIAKAIALSVKDFDEDLILYGLSQSCSITEAGVIGVKTAGEAFADRTYQDDGSLTSRSLPEALIGNASEAVKQVLQIVKESSVTTVSGKNIQVVAETICIHGDGEHAVEFAKAINEALKKEKINLKTVS